MIKINLVREGRAVRGAGPGAAPVAAAAGGAGASNINNILVGGLFVLGLVVAGGYWFLKNRELKGRQETVSQRKLEAEKLEAIINDVEQYQRRKDNLQKRIDLINQLKQNQKGPVKIMDRISQDLPDLVWLDSMNVGGGRISIVGRGLNPNAIANFIENIKNDPYFEEPQVGSVTAMGGAPPVYAFDMNFAFTFTPKGAETTDTAATGTAGTAGTGGTAKPGP